MNDIGPNAEPELCIKVAFINKLWYAKLSCGPKEIDRMACKSRWDISWICWEMLRWYSRLGGCSKWAEAAQKRQTGKSVGKVYYDQHLKLKRM